MKRSKSFESKVSFLIGKIEMGVHIRHKRSQIHFGWTVIFEKKHKAISIPFWLTFRVSIFEKKNKAIYSILVEALLMFPIIILLQNNRDDL